MHFDINNREQIAKHLAKTWGVKTLSELRNQAAKEFNGTIFESLRFANGRRCLLIFCVTGEHEIELLSRISKSSEMREPLDWSAVTLGVMVMQTALGEGFRCETERDDVGATTSILLIASEPRSIAILEEVFNLPR
jgi:hypothetical protein